MTLDVYYSATPNGWKISIMVEELREAGADLPDVNLHLTHGVRMAETLRFARVSEKEQAADGSEHHQPRNQDDA